ncbi:MAG: hypothetical protein ACRDTR_20040, partial [Rubrobacter sp.]
MRASIEPVLSTNLMERYGTPRLSLRTVASDAKNVVRNFVPGPRSRTQDPSFFSRFPSTYPLT